MHKFAPENIKCWLCSVYVQKQHFQKGVNLNFTNKRLKCAPMFTYCPICICRTDSEIFEDSVELQQFFIKIRDELCKNGEILLSTALNYTLKHLHSDVDQEKREKIPKEIEEDKEKKGDEEEEENKGV